MIDLDDFVKQHERALFNFALQLTKSEQESEDLLQDTWIKCLVHQMTLENMTMQKQRSWLFTVLKNRWLDICRHRKLELMVSRQADPMPPASSSSPRFDAHLDKLPPLERDIVYQKFWLGLNSREISTELGIPEGTVRWRLKLAMEKLKKYVVQSDKEERCLL